MLGIDASFGFGESAGVKVAKILNDLILLLLREIGLDQMTVDDSLYEIPEYFCVDGLRFHICDIEKHLLAKVFLLRTFVRI